MNTLGNRKKIRGCTHKDTNNKAANYFRQPLLVPNNAKALHFYQIVHLTNFLTFSLINISQKIRNKRIFFEKLKEYTYKITQVSVASYPFLKLKPRTNFYLSVFFILFNVFLHIHEYANEIICLFISGSRSYISTFIWYHVWRSMTYMAAEI